MSELLNKHFAAELAALGYPTEDVRYSLGYCQGDGVAFYGRVSGEGLDRLIAAVDAATRASGRQLEPRCRPG